MACRLFVATSLPELILIYCQLDISEHLNTAFIMQENDVENACKMATIFHGFNMLKFAQNYLMWAGLHIDLRRDKV